MAEETPGSWFRRAATGDEHAWGQLVDRYNAMVWSIARSFRLNDADAADVVQTTWLRLIEHLGTINDPDRIGSWLATTVRNECLVQLRRQGRQAVPTEMPEEFVDERPPPDNALLVAERDAELWAALDRISGRCRQLLRVLASDPPPSYQEISAALELPIGSIGPTRARCLEKLRQVMERPVGVDAPEGLL